MPSNELVIIMARRPINLTMASTPRFIQGPDQRTMANTIACRFGACRYCGHLHSISKGPDRLFFLHLWLFCTSPWPRACGYYAYNNANWGGGYEKVLRYRLFIGIGVKRCWLRGQRQVPGWGKGKSSSASRRNEGLVSVEHRAGPRGQARALCPKWSSRPEEFHLQALPEPYVNLSIHTAPDVRPLADEPPALPRPRAPPVARWLQLACGLG